MASASLNGSLNSCPEYILPDDPPDVKPDLKMLKVKDKSLVPRRSRSPSAADDSPSDPVEAMKEEPTAGPSGSAAAPGLERVKLEVSEAEEAVRRDDELGLVETALSRTLRPVLRRCDEVLPRLDCVHVSAITAGQRRHLGRLNITPLTEIVTDFVKLEVEEHELEDDPVETISEIQGSHTSTDKSLKTGGKPVGKRIKECSAIPRCVHCKSACLAQDHLDKHVKQRHGHIDRDGRHKCEWCEYSTDNISNFQQHRVVHTGERLHRCNHCGKTFGLISNLRRHLRIHSGQKPYSCDVCRKAFAQLSHLMRHGLIHSGERPYSCDVCSKTFARLYDLKCHRRIHSGQKPYSCDACGKAFSVVSHLTRHRRIHTAQWPETVQL